MFKDDLKYSYVELEGRRNVIGQCRKDFDLESAELSIPSYQLRLIDQLTRERPTWRFRAAVSFFKSCNITNFTVFDGDEELGNISWNGAAYTFDNPRLRAKRERGGVNYSTKLDVATKRILKAFHTKTRKERGQEAAKATKEAVSSVTNTSAFGFRRKFQPVQDLLTTYLVRNWDEASKYLTSVGAAADPTVPELHANQQTARQMGEAVQNARGVTIRIEGTGYLSVREYANSLETEVYSGETLPDHYRAGLGILKLVEPQTTVAGVGLRVDQHTFLILDPQKI